MLKAVLRGEAREKKKKREYEEEEEDWKIICLNNRTRLEEKNMGSLEEKRLRSENVCIESIFEDKDYDSVTSM